MGNEGSRDSSVDIAAGYGIRGLDSRQGLGIFLFSSVQNGFGSHPASYPMATGGSFPGDTTPGV
jgi:hypothetical protein